MNLTIIKANKGKLERFINTEDINGINIVGILYYDDITNISIPCILINPKECSVNRLINYINQSSFQGDKLCIYTNLLEEDLKTLIGYLKYTSKFYETVLYVKES